jgi:hypothetical protein
MGLVNSPTLRLLVRWNLNADDGSIRKYFVLISKWTREKNSFPFSISVLSGPALEAGLVMHFGWVGKCA